MITQIIGWISIICAVWATICGVKSGWNDETNTEAEIALPLFLIAAAICFK